MTFAEYETDSWRSYEIFPSGRYEFAQSQIPVRIANRAIQPYDPRRAGKEIGLLIGVEMLADKKIMTTWATGYGQHNKLVQEVTGDSTRTESVLQSQLVLDDGLFNIVGSYYLTTTGANPTLYIGGERLKNEPGTDRLELVDFDEKDKELVRNLTLACGRELGRLAGEQAFYADMQYSFATPTCDFTEHGTLYLDLTS